MRRYGIQQGCMYLVKAIRYLHSENLPSLPAMTCTNFASSPHFRPVPGPQLGLADHYPCNCADTRVLSASKPTPKQSYNPAWAASRTQGWLRTHGMLLTRMLPTHTQPRAATRQLLCHKLPVLRSPHSGRQMMFF